VGIVLLTSDDHVVILKRSLWTGECAGMYDRPGGHPEPSEVGILKPYLNGEKKFEDISAAAVNAAVRREVRGDILIFSKY